MSCLFTSQVLSVFASTLGTFTVSWMIYDQTGSKTAMGGLWLISICGQMSVQFLAGPYIDRWKRITMMRLSEVIRIVAYAIALLLFLFKPLPILPLYFVSLLSSIVVYDSAASAIIPKLAPKDKLVKVNARIAGMVQLVRLITLPIAGIIVTSLGYMISIGLIIALFMISFVLLNWVPEPDVDTMVKPKWASQFKNGLKIYKTDKILLLMGFFISVTSFGVFATQAMYIPYVSEILRGESFEYGLFAASFPIGYILGTFIVGNLKEPEKYLFIVMLTALFAGGVTYVLLAITKTLMAAILIEAAAGVFMPFWNVYSTTLYQRIVPQSIMGQVFSVRFLLTKAATPLGIIYGTFCASTFGLPMLFLSIGALICTVSGVGITVMCIKRPRSIAVRDS
jgi:MFS family permease